MAAKDIEKYQFTKDNAREMQKRGAKKAYEGMKRTMEMRQIIRDLMDMPLYKGTPEELQYLAESKGKNITVAEAMVLSQIQKALKGDIKAIEFLRDTAGFKPEVKISAEANIKTEQAISDLAAALYNEENKEDDE